MLEVTFLVVMENVAEAEPAGMVYRRGHRRAARVRAEHNDGAARGRGSAQRRGALRDP